MSILRTILLLVRDKHYRSHFILTLVLLLIGTIFYHVYEQWSWVDSVYFSVITLTTVGYGDLHPVTDVGKIFTTCYIMFGIGILLSFINLFADKLIEERKKSVEIFNKKRKK